MTAIEKNSVDAVKILTENGASFVDGKLKNNFLKINPHPIVYAVQNDRVEIVKYFLTRFDDALKDFTCYDMNSALENAQYNQNIEMVETLCVFIKDNYQKFAPKSPIEYFINQAILRNYPVEILNSLFGIGVVDYSYQNERDGLTLLHSAVKSKNLEAVKYLIEKGANPNMKDSSNDTPLSMAIKKKQSEIAELLANDSNLDVNMKIGRSNYLKMAQAKKFDNLVSILKGKGAIE
ncbi:hypothetical protein TRFO_15388 [Tritrichomonas foetus]|uniref:Uncharacterized protein n=1 Tax=Tritrichomonas foetus TaxID=1144522 RepID=A0A1J4KXA2_9EUKA|nr:hypothetical protein TRFO_15388 [Tritrichomonas foetus]|eukprot:OHT14332.1 hypothetical protein TRFO_15388 [Tritrichomonas foetus]